MVSTFLDGSAIDCKKGAVAKAEAPTAAPALKGKGKGKAERGLGVSSALPGPQHCPCMQANAAKPAAESAPASGPSETSTSAPAEALHFTFSE